MFKIMFIVVLFEYGCILGTVKGLFWTKTSLMRIIKVRLVFVDINEFE